MIYFTYPQVKLIYILARIYFTKDNKFLRILPNFRMTDYLPLIILVILQKHRNVYRFFDIKYINSKTSTEIATSKSQTQTFAIFLRKKEKTNSIGFPSINLS